MGKAERSETKGRKEAKMLKLKESILRHSIGVAEFMAEWATTHPERGYGPDEMYVLGLLHDIGKIYPIVRETDDGIEVDDSVKNPYKGHGRKGADLLERLGFIYSKEVRHHGHPEDPYYSCKLMLLNLADMSVDGTGQVIPVERRLRSIKRRYGDDSEEYAHAEQIVRQLVDQGLLTENGEIL